MRLDDDKLEALRRWGEGLREAGREESAAAGRAILMLIEEVEWLRLEQLRAREQLSHLTRVASGEASQGAEERVESTLHGRVQRVLRRPTPILLPRPNRRLWKRRDRARKPTKREHRRNLGSRRYGDRSDAYVSRAELRLTC